MKLEPNHWEALINLADVLITMDKHNVGEAIHLYDQADNACPANAAIKIRMSKARLLNNERDLALAAAREAVDVEGGNSSSEAMDYLIGLLTVLDCKHEAALLKAAQTESEDSSLRKRFLAYAANS